MTAAEYIGMSGQTLPTIGATQHHLGLPLIHIQGDKAWSRCYFMAQHVKNGVLEAGGVPVNSSLVVLGAVPVAGAAVLWALRRARQHLHAPDL